jgi:hypothetical protein
MVRAVKAVNVVIAVRAVGSKSGTLLTSPRRRVGRLRDVWSSTSLVRPNRSVRTNFRLLPVFRLEFATPVAKSEQESYSLGSVWMINAKPELENKSRPRISQVNLPCPKCFLDGNAPQPQRVTKGAACGIRVGC